MWEGNSHTIHKDYNQPYPDVESCSCVLILCPDPVLAILAFLAFLTGTDDKLVNLTSLVLALALALALALVLVSW